LSARLISGPVFLMNLRLAERTAPQKLVGQVAQVGHRTFVAYAHARTRVITNTA
jgi:hypothetical protein